MIDGAANERVDKGLELGTEELEVDVLGTGGVLTIKGRLTSVRVEGSSTSAYSAAP
jgi:hypothetical protein